MQRTAYAILFRSMISLMKMLLNRCVRKGQVILAPTKTDYILINQEAEAARSLLPPPPNLVKRLQQLLRRLLRPTLLTLFLLVRSTNRLAQLVLCECTAATTVVRRVALSEGSDL